MIVWNKTAAMVWEASVNERSFTILPINDVTYLFIDANSDKEQIKTFKDCPSAIRFVEALASFDKHQQQD
ncbi:hypothetical protein ACFBZI_11760 [Moraxella sp. ZJ142]|uniref:hypothetical protein n=1 Tax=Moraxella marmotae TaxID=3344520 RepID=UPI0035D3FAAA